MTPILRPAEPPALAAVRAKRLPAARSAAGSGAKVDFGDYAVVKTELANMQRLKCCYCETLQEQAKYRDVEHYRPKSPYWWLTWTWENLLFSCEYCNRDCKHDAFPLWDGTARLAAEQDPPGAERPLVLDPSDPTVHPMDHIRFVRERHQGLERWIPRGLSFVGSKTIETCGLDRPALLDRYRDHVNDTVRSKLEPFRAALETGDARVILDRWSTATRSLLAPSRSFRALSHDALDVLVPPGTRATHGLVLIRPA